MEQIFTALLTDLKIVHAHLLLRSTYQKLPIYRQQINDWIICNNLHIEIVEQTDANINQNKIQFCSVLEYNNGIKSVENLYCGPYANGVIPFALNMHHNKVEPHLDFIGIRPFKFKVRPFIKIQESLLKIKHLRKRHDRNDEQSKSPNRKEGEHNQHLSTHICTRRKKGQDGISWAEEKDERQYSGRKCYCCSNRSNEEDESSGERGFQRSPLKLKFQNTGGKGLKNWPQENREKDQDIQQVKNKIHLPLRGKSSQSSRNKSSPSLHLHALMKRSKHPNNRSNSGSFANLMPSTNRYAKCVESHKNGSASLSNKWINSQHHQQTNVQNSPNDQKSNIRAKPAKKQKHLLEGIRGVHSSLGKNGQVIQNDQIMRQQRQSKLSKQINAKNKVKVQENQSKLGMKQTLHPQRFSEMVEPFGYSKDEKIPLNNNLVQPLDEVKQDKILLNSVRSKIRQQPLKMQNIKKSNRKPSQKQINNLFAKSNLDQMNNYVQKQSNSLKPVNLQTGKAKTNRIKKIPLAQKMQIMKQQQKKQDLSGFKEKSTKNMTEAIDNHERKRVDQLRTKNNKQQNASLQMNEETSRQEKQKHQQPNMVDQEPKKETNDNWNLQFQLQKQNILLSGFNGQAEQCQPTVAKVQNQQMKEITDTLEDFSMTQQYIFSKDENIKSNPCETHEVKCIENSQRISGNTASINDDASTIKEVDYKQEQPSDMGNNQIRHSQKHCSTSRTIPYWLQPSQKSEKILQNTINFDRQNIGEEEKLQKPSSKEPLEQVRLSYEEGNVSLIKGIQSEFKQMKQVESTENRQQGHQPIQSVQPIQQSTQQKQFRPNQDEQIQIIQVENEQAKLKYTKQEYQGLITPLANIQTLKMQSEVGSSHIPLSDRENNELNYHIISKQVDQNSSQYYLDQKILEDVKSSNHNPITLNNNPLEINQSLQNPALPNSEAEERQPTNSNSILEYQIHSINRLSSNIQKQQFYAIQNGQMKSSNRLQQKKTSILNIENTNQDDKNDGQYSIEQNNNHSAVNQPNQGRKNLSPNTALTNINQQDNILTDVIQQQEKNLSNQILSNKLMGKHYQRGDNKAGQLQIQLKQADPHLDSVFDTQSRNDIQQQTVGHHDPPNTTDHNENIPFMLNNNELGQDNAVQIMSTQEAEHLNYNQSQVIEPEQLNQQKIVQRSQQQVVEEAEWENGNKNQNQQMKEETNNCLFSSNKLININEHSCSVVQRQQQLAVIEEEKKDNQKQMLQPNTISNQKQEYEEESNLSINLRDGDIQSNDVPVVKERECFKVQDNNDNLPKIVLRNQDAEQQGKGIIQLPNQQQNQLCQVKTIPLEIGQNQLEMTNKSIIDSNLCQKPAILQKIQYRFNNEDIVQSMQMEKKSQQNMQQFDHQRQYNNNIIDIADSSSKQIYSSQKKVDHSVRSEQLSILHPFPTNQHAIQKISLQDEALIEDINAKSEIKTTENKSMPKILQQEQLELETQHIKPEQNFSPAEAISVNQTLPIALTRLQQNANQQILNKQTSSFIQESNNEQKIIQILPLCNEQQQIIINPNKEGKNRQTTDEAQMQLPVIPELQADISSTNAQIIAGHEPCIKKGQNVQYSDPIQPLPQNQQQFIIKQQKIQQPEQGKTINNSKTQAGKHQNNIINSQKIGVVESHKQKQQQKNHITNPTQNIPVTFIERIQNNVIINKQVIKSQVYGQRQTQPQNNVAQNKIQNTAKDETIQKLLSEDILQQTKYSQEQHRPPQKRQQDNQQPNDKLAQKLQMNLQEIDGNNNKKETDGQKWKRQYLLNTISVQTDELLKSFQQIETQQLVSNIMPIYAAKQSEICNKNVLRFQKQTRIQTLLSCDPQFANLSDNSSRKDLNAIISRNSGDVEIRNNLLSQNAHQFQSSRGESTSNNRQSNYKNKIENIEQDIPNNNNNYAKTKETNLIQPHQLKFGESIPQIDHTQYEQSTKQLNLPSLLKRQFQQEQVDLNNQQQTLLENNQMDIAQQIVQQDQQMQIDLQNEQCTQTSHPLIIEQIVNNNISIVKFEQTFIHRAKDSKKQEIINNAISFIEYHLPGFISLLLNKENSQICLFIEGQWTIFKAETSSQAFTLQNLLFLNLKEQSVFRCIDMLTGMPMRILKDKQQGISNKRLLKSIKTLIEKKENEEYEKIMYSVHKATHEIVCLHKIRNFLDNNNQLKVILECKKINRQSQNPQEQEGLYNLEGQSVQQFVQIHLLSSIRYLTFDVNKETINTYELQLSNVVLYLNGTYKFILYQEFNRNEYKLAKESYKWMGYHCPEAVTKFLLIIEPIPDKEGQDRITLRLGLSKDQELPSVYRLISSEKGLKARNCKGGYQNVSNVYLPVIKQIIKGKTCKKEKVIKQ